MFSQVREHVWFEVDVNPAGIRAVGMKVMLVMDTSHSVLIMRRGDPPGVKIMTLRICIHSFVISQGLF